MGAKYSPMSTLGRKNPQTYREFSRGRLQHLQRRNVDVRQCFFIPSQAITTTWARHGPVFWEHVASQSREQPFDLVVSFTRRGSYQHALRLQLLIPSKLWIEMLAQKEPNPGIFRYCRSCVETVLFSGLSSPWYSTPQELVGTSHNEAVVPIASLSFYVFYCAESAVCGLGAWKPGVGICSPVWCCLAPHVSLTTYNQKKRERCALVLLTFCLIVSPKPLYCVAMLVNLMPRDVIMSKLSEILLLLLLCILPTSQGCCEAWLMLAKHLNILWWKAFKSAKYYFTWLTKLNLNAGM